MHLLAALDELHYFILCLLQTQLLCRQRLQQAVRWKTEALRAERNTWLGPLMRESQANLGD
jgi:hypothetical protein